MPWGFSQGPLALEPLKDEEAMNAKGPDGKHNDEGQHVRCIENQSGPEGPTLAFAGGKAQADQGATSRLPRHAGAGVGPDQLSSIKRNKVNESDVDETKEPNRKQPRPEAGKPSGNEKVHAVGLGVISEFSTARIFAALYSWSVRPRGVKGLHRVDIMPQDGALFNENRNV